MRIFLWLVIITAVLVGGLYTLNNYIYNEKQADEGIAAHYKDGRYLIDGKVVDLQNGESKVPAAPGSLSMITTKYFGNEVMGDVDGDGDRDVVFLVTHDGGGSGTFFYLVGAIREGTGYRGTTGVFIGDRIAPQTTEIRPDGVIVVNYIDRKPGEPMVTEPSVATSLYFKYDPEANNFGEVVQDFEGEADPARMTLGMKTWIWVSAGFQKDDDSIMKPRQKDAFAITFGSDGRFFATTDCNQMGGSYTLGADNAITFSDIISTKKYCEESQEGEFAKLLMDTSRYHFTSRGELVLSFKFDSGTATFR